MIAATSSRAWSICPAPVLLCCLVYASGCRCVSCPPQPGGPGGGACQIISKPEDIKYDYTLDMPNPPPLRFAYLQGDPTRSGPYTLRAKIPPGMVQVPHFHRHDEYGVVISGKYFTGDGNVVDPNIAPLPLGSFGFIPAGCRHYAFTTDQEAIVEVHGEGPWVMMPVDAQGQPTGEVMRLQPRRR